MNQVKTPKPWPLMLTVALAAWPGTPMAQETQGDSDDLTGFAVRYAAAWSGQDPSAFAEFYAENGSLRVNQGEPAIGREAIANMAAGFMAAFPDMTVRLLRLDRVGGRVIFNWRWTGTNTGPGGTGNAVDLTGYEEWTLDGSGLILESLGRLDDVEYQRQLNAGADSAPGD